MTKRRKKSSKKTKPHTCQFGKWKVPDDAVVIDGGIVGGTDSGYEQEFHRTPPPPPKDTNDRTHT